MSIAENIIKFSIKKNLGKWIKGAATVLVANASKIAAEKAGFQLTADQQLQLEVAAGSAFLGAINFLKIKFPNQFGWL